jgi:2,3-bisphosphoglycerate-independent phosphoglycerate mutase
MSLSFERIPGVPRVPVVLCILDGVGWGRRDDTDAVFMAKTPVLDSLMASSPHCLLRAHGTAVGLPSDADMGNSEVGHNAMGAGRVVDQGAKLVDEAIASERIFESESWKRIVAARTVHFLGLVSDGNVHSNVAHLRALVVRAVADGVKRIRVHALTDGRDVSERSALTWITPMEAGFAEIREADVRIASGGGRMRITMDRYEADWAMVERGWNCHVHGIGRPFGSATAAIQTMYDETALNDQWLEPFVVFDDGHPVGRIEDGDAVVLFNFRGDRAIEISRAFEDSVPFDRGHRPKVFFAGMMQYDGDTKIPANYLVDPPAIDRTVGEYLAAAGERTYAVSETQKFGHVTYFFNGNRSGLIDAKLEQYAEVASERVPFDQAPEMRARAITAEAAEAIRSKKWDHVRLNLANGDMVGHTGNFAATVKAMECVDACVGELMTATRAAGGVLLITADHGNADEMYELDKKGAPILVNGVRKPRTSHSLNPVPFILVDATGRWRLADVPGAGIANVGATVLNLCGIATPPGYLPSLVALR